MRYYIYAPTPTPENNYAQLEWGWATSEQSAANMLREAMRTYPSLEWHVTDIQDSSRDVTTYILYWTTNPTETENAS